MHSLGLRKLSTIFLLFTLFLFSKTSIIRTDNKCFGNNIFVNFKCQPCPVGYFAKNNKCTKQSDFSFGSNLNEKVGNLTVIL